MICYHGTRNYNGGDLLPYSPDGMKSYIDRLLQKIGLSFRDWSERGYMASRIIADLEDAKRQRIWLTDNVETAKSYATRSPEIAWDALMDAIDNILWSRRWRQSNMLKLCKARNEWIADILEGRQMVLTVSVAEGGFNYPIDFIPKEDILEVLTLQSRVKGGNMIIGVRTVVCTCGDTMRRTGGHFGEIMHDTYYCDDCQKHVIVVTPNQGEQKEFAQKLRRT